MGLKKYLKRLKKKASKVVKAVGKVAIKTVKYAAPLVGTLVAGPLGGAAGTALASVAATHRAKNKTKALIRTAGYGLAVTAGVTGLKALLGPSAKPAAEESSTPLSKAFDPIDPSDKAGHPDGTVFNLPGELPGIPEDFPGGSDEAGTPDDGVVMEPAGAAAGGGSAGPLILAGIAAVALLSGK